MGTIDTGNLGEDIACRFLKNKGFRVIERNYRKKWGEIDIIASRARTLTFVEVKAVFLKEGGPPYRAVENVHQKKLERLSRTIETYLASVKGEKEWNFGVLVVEMDPQHKNATVEFIENVVIGS